jgi:hypothetical protein
MSAAFTQQLDSSSQEYFANVIKQPFAKQATQFLNAYWNEVGSQAPFIFAVSHQVLVQCDMHFQGISLVHQYEEGVEIDFNCAMYFYEKLALKVLENAEGQSWREDAMVCCYILLFISLLHFDTH